MKALGLPNPLSVQMFLVSRGHGALMVGALSEHDDVTLMVEFIYMGFASYALIKLDKFSFCSATSYSG